MMLSISGQKTLECGWECWNYKMSIRVGVLSAVSKGENHLLGTGTGTGT